jgi:hypothetical protein
MNLAGVSIRLLAASLLTITAGGAARTQSNPAWPPAVGVVEATRRPITESSEFLGRIEAINRVNVVARVTAFLERRVFEEGAEIKTGDELHRLEMVIAFIITIAGALALMQIPVAQFPDIVPPQVTVSGTFPGASAEVVESSVAQPLEAQIIGVDRALYMKSTSANDGSYTLTVSFALGTNPDINTVNVNNRCAPCLPVDKLA